MYNMICTSITISSRKQVTCFLIYIEDDTFGGGLIYLLELFCVSWAAEL